LIGFINTLIFTILLNTTLDASLYNNGYKKYNDAKRNYAKIIGYNNKVKEIKYLKELIYYGKKLDKSTAKYTNELKRLSKVVKLYPKNQKIKVAKSKYSIKQVYQTDNEIVIIFNHKITKKNIRYFTKKSKNSYQYIFDIKGRFKDAYPTKLKINNVDRIKIVQYKYNTLRISVKNKKRLKNIYIIGYKKIIIRFKKSKEHYYSATNLYKTSIAKIRKKIIVIDAGHGGKDVGAIGIYRKYEKNVTLKIAINLYKILKNRGYNVYLTRNRDKFISLKYRTKLANKKNANMFISIHANSTPKSKSKYMQGIETYFLSPARSDRAKRVAALENKVDMNSMNWSSQSTFLTVLNQSKITASNKMAIDIQKNILYSLRKRYGLSSIKDGGVREGPFWVLVGAQMPSILIEVGYISHPIEGRRVYTKSYQKLIAKAISNGVDSYFLKNQ
jgi:N-acetylmuramoyl-L-alanine amidase